MKILLISPYHGGSHQSWAEGYMKYSQHEVQLLTLPAHYWKWRMQGGAVTLARMFWQQPERPNLILATDLLDLTTFLALTRQYTHDVPVVLYMHENQLTYPLPEDGRTGPMRRQLGERDMHYAFINYVSMMTADVVFFNSRYHLESWFAALPNLLKHFPDYNELASVDELKRKSQVLPVGVDFQRLRVENFLTAENAEDTEGKNQNSALFASSAVKTNPLPPLVLWNQRWEYDKNPEAFLAALYAVMDIPFRVALCGQWYVKRPLYLDAALEKLGDRIVHLGYADEETYKRLLWEADVVISTAHHEFFGISILEAVYCHTFPILPRRLSYPELIPEPYHLKCLYQNQGGLVQRLKWALTHVEEARESGRELGTVVATYDWMTVSPTYDAAFTHLIQKQTSQE